MTFHRRGVGAPGLFPAAQNGSVTGFQAQGGDIHRHVWTGFINHADNAERHAATLQTQTAVEQPTVNHLPYRVGQIADLTNIVGDAFQARRVSARRSSIASLTVATRFQLNLARWRAKSPRTAIPDNQRFFPARGFSRGWKERQFVRGGLAAAPICSSMFWLLNE
jgi:hypothetical protein